MPLCLKWCAHSFPEVSRTAAVAVEDLISYSAATLQRAYWRREGINFYWQLSVLIKRDVSQHSCCLFSFLPPLRSFEVRLRGFGLSQVAWSHWQCLLISNADVVDRSQRWQFWILSNFLCWHPSRLPHCHQAEFIKSTGALVTKKMSIGTPNSSKAAFMSPVKGWFDQPSQLIKTTSLLWKFFSIRRKTVRSSRLSFTNTSLRIWPVTRLLRVLRNLEPLQMRPFCATQAYFKTSPSWFFVPYLLEKFSPKYFCIVLLALFDAPICRMNFFIFFTCL